MKAGNGSTFPEHPSGYELFEFLLGEDFEAFVNDQHHIFAVRDMMKSVCLLDGTLEAEGEDEVFNESEHIYHEFFEVGRFPNLGE